MITDRSTGSNREDCEAIVRQLWPYLDGILPNEHRERVTRHLENCADCQSHFDFAAAFLEAVGAALPASGGGEPNAALRERVLAALGAEGFNA
jgi:anti-sigma factor (TIGR02949 family)